MMNMVRQAGKIVHMHSDGDIRQLVDDIIEGGCQVINLQDLVNGIDWIAEHFRGRTCVELDIDRQNITYAGTPKDIDDLIREEVEKIATPQLFLQNRSVSPRTIFKITAIVPLVVSRIAPFLRVCLTRCLPVNLCLPGTDNRLIATERW